jgi:hypothetical protein
MISYCRTPKGHFCQQLRYDAMFLPHVCFPSTWNLIHNISRIMRANMIKLCCAPSIPYWSDHISNTHTNNILALPSKFSILTLMTWNLTCKFTKPVAHLTMPHIYLASLEYGFKLIREIKFTISTFQTPFQENIFTLNTIVLCRFIREKNSPSFPLVAPVGDGREP